MMPQVPNLPNEDRRYNLDKAQFEYAVYKDQRDFDARFDEQLLPLAVLMGIGVAVVIGGLLGLLIEHWQVTLATIVSLEIIAVCVLAYFDRSNISRIWWAGRTAVLFLAFCVAVFVGVFAAFGFGWPTWGLLAALAIIGVTLSFVGATAAVARDSAEVDAVRSAIEQFLPTPSLKWHPLDGTAAWYFQSRFYDPDPQDAPIDVTPNAPRAPVSENLDFGSKAVPGSLFDEHATDNTNDGGQFNGLQAAQAAGVGRDDSFESTARDPVNFGRKEPQPLNPLPAAHAPPQQPAFESRRSGQAKSSLKPKSGVDTQTLTTFLLAFDPNSKEDAKEAARLFPGRDIFEKVADAADFAEDPAINARWRVFMEWVILYLMDEEPPLEIEHKKTRLLPAH